MFFSRLVSDFINTILKLPFNIDTSCIELILKNLVSFISLDLIATFRLQYEDDFEYEFSVLSTHFKFEVRMLRT